MTTQRGSLLLTLLLALALAAPAQETEPSRGSSFGFRVGYSASSGDWNNVRYAPSVKLLKPGLVVDADVTLPISGKLSIVLDGSYQPMDGSDWEAYAALQGDQVRVSGSFLTLGVLLRPYLKSGEADLIWFEFGPALLFPSGDETYNGGIYEYDFFNSLKVGGQGGIGYERMLGKGTALTVKAGALVFPTGFSYSDGAKFTMLVFPASAGIRLYL